jgi:hypothetical protein
LYANDRRKINMKCIEEAQYYVRDNLETADIDKEKKNNHHSFLILNKQILNNN